MTDIASQIAEHMEVVGNDGRHVGTVDKLEANRIKLTKDDDPGGLGQHHYLPLGAVAAVKGGRVHLSIPAVAAKGEALAGDPGA